MGLASLLISRDTTVLRVLRPTLEKLSITVELCSGARSGGELLISSKFDAVIVDCDDLEALPFDNESESGRGLLLLDRLATSWGSRPSGTGKVVWFEVPRFDSP